MNLTIVAVLAVGAVIVGSVLAISPNQKPELEASLSSSNSTTETWQDAYEGLDSRITDLDSRTQIIDDLFHDLFTLQGLDDRVRLLEMHTKVPNVQGFAYYDIDGDCLYDDEVGAPGVIVLATNMLNNSDVHRTITNADGLGWFRLTTSSQWLFQAEGKDIAIFDIDVNGQGVLASFSAPLGNTNCPIQDYTYPDIEAGSCADTWSSAYNMEVFPPDEICD